jgi:hypothetical protein
MTGRPRSSPIAATVASKASAMAGSTPARRVGQAITREGRTASMGTDPTGSSSRSVPVGPASTSASSMTSATVACVAPDDEKAIQRGAESRPMTPMVGL